MKTACGIDLAATGNKTVYLELGWNKIARTNKNTSGQCVYALPSTYLTFRTLELPFNDKKKSKEIVKEELSYSLAFPIEDSVWDFVIGQPDNNAFAAVALKQDIPKEIEKNDSLDGDIACLARTAAYCGHKNALIIDFGASKTLFTGITGGGINFAKVITTGSSYITAAIAKIHKLTDERAEQFKIEKGIASPEIKNIITGILKKADLPEFTWDEIIICGGGGQLKGLGDFLNEGYKKPIKNFYLPENISPFTEAVAFGAAIKEKYPQTAINLVENDSTEKTIPIKWIIMVLLPLLLLPIHLFLKGSYYEKQAENYNTEISKAIKAEFPEIQTIKAPVAQLQAKIDGRKISLRKKNYDLLSALESVAESTKGKKLIVYDIDSSKENISISGEADSYSEIDSVRAELLRKYDDVNLEIRSLPSKKISFNLTIKPEVKKKNAAKV